MPKIILFAPLSGITGGIRNWARNIVSYCNSLTNPDIEIITFDFSRNNNGHLQNNVIVRLFLCIKDYFPLIVKSIRFIRKTEADIVHITSPASFLLVKDLLFILCAHHSEKKVIIHFHFGRIPELFRSQSIERFLLERVIKMADCAVVMDQLSLRTLAENGYGNVLYIPNPVSSDVFPILNEPRPQPQNNSILFAGHVIKTKGVEELILACKEIPQAHLKIVGAVSENYRNCLKSLAGDNPDEWLEICGELDYASTIRAMRENAIFVLPSYTEGFPNVILESMACGCAIVATAVGAIPEMLDAENVGQECGKVVPPRDVEQLRSAILYMLSDSQFAGRCSCNAKKRLMERYTISQVWTQLSDMWKNVNFAERYAGN